MAMMTSHLLLLLALQASLGASLAIGPSPTTPTDLSQAIPDALPILDVHNPSIHPSNLTLGDPPDPLDIHWAQNRYLTTFHTYTYPQLPPNCLREFIDEAIADLNHLRQANHAELDDPVPDGLFEHKAEFPALAIDLRLALYPPGAATALTYHEVAGVIASMAPYMRRWDESWPASAELELWKRGGAVFEQKASGHIFGLERDADQ